MNWTTARFVASYLHYDFSRVGFSMLDKGFELDTIMARPRTADNMQVTLTKRLLLKTGKQFVQGMMAAKQRA